MEGGREGGREGVREGGRERINPRPRQFRQFEFVLVSYFPRISLRFMVKLD